MSDDSAPRADGFKYSEIKSEAATVSLGARPGLPIRKRGYYRALKRGETWAVHIDSQKGIMKTLARAFYPTVVNMINGPQPSFLSRLEKIVKDE